MVLTSNLIPKKPGSNRVNCNRVPHVFSRVPQAMSATYITSLILTLFPGEYS